MQQHPFASSEVEKRERGELGFSTSLETNGEFSVAALRLAGLAGALLGWRPVEFWDATPAELAGVFGAMNPPSETPVGGDVLAQLQELFPDG
jgi:hypothetical protein